MSAFLKTITLGIVLAASFTLASCAGTTDGFSGSSVPPSSVHSSGMGMMPMLD
jgi:hypothetical protein